MDFTAMKKNGAKSRQMRVDGYKAGGRVRGGAAPRASKPDGGAMIDGGAARPRLDRPGPKKAPGKVNVNVIVAKGGGKREPDGDEMMPVTATLPPSPPPTPGLGPPPMRRHGGRITAGAESGVGRIQVGKMARNKK